MSSKIVQKFNPQVHVCLGGGRLCDALSEVLFLDFLGPRSGRDCAQLLTHGHQTRIFSPSIRRQKMNLNLNEPDAWNVHTIGG